MEARRYSWEWHHSQWHHTQHSTGQASQREQIYLPFLKNVYIWRRNSKSPDVNQNGMGKHLRWSRCSDGIFQFNCILNHSKFSCLSQVRWKGISIWINVLYAVWVFGSVLPIPAPGFQYLLLSISEANTDIRACWEWEGITFQLYKAKDLGLKKFVSNGQCNGFQSKCLLEHIWYFLGMFGLFLHG